MKKLYLFALLALLFTACEHENNEEPKPDKAGIEDYSGICYLGGNRYAVVSDRKSGFYIFNIDTDANGSITKLSRGDFYGDAGFRNCEGIAYHPGRKTVFIAAENDMRILEYNLDGTKTGNQLALPAVFRDAVFNYGDYDSNYGLESIGYSGTTGLFWTTTETTLTIDGSPATYDNRVNNLLRLQSFNESLQPEAQYAYKTDIPECTALESTVFLHAFGVSEMIALPDGRLLILEREFYVGKGLAAVGLSWVKNKIFLVDPVNASDVSNEADLRHVDDHRFLEKQKLWEFKTSLIDKNIANYEGMCLGPAIAKGTYPLLLVNDSQSGYGGILKEYVLPLIIKGVPDSRSEMEEMGKATIVVSANPYQNQLIIDNN